MEKQSLPQHELDTALARRLKALRHEHALSLDELASRSGVSRTTLSRLENAETSPTANALGRLCTVYGLTLSRLMSMVETQSAPLLRYSDQSVWKDPETGFVRRITSPPGPDLQGEAIEGTLQADTHISYDASPRPGLEHHLVLLEGRLTLQFADRSYDLSAGDCLRYRLNGANAFQTPPDSGARYLIFMV